MKLSAGICVALVIALIMACGNNDDDDVLGGGIELDVAKQHPAPRPPPPSY